MIINYLDAFLSNIQKVSFRKKQPMFCYTHIANNVLKIIQIA